MYKTLYDSDVYSIYLKETPAIFHKHIAGKLSLSISFTILLRLLRHPFLIALSLAVPVTVYLFLGFLDRCIGDMMLAKHAKHENMDNVIDIRNEIFRL